MNLLTLPWYCWVRLKCRVITCFSGWAFEIMTTFDYWFNQSPQETLTFSFYLKTRPKTGCNRLNRTTQNRKPPFKSFCSVYDWRIWGELFKRLRQVSRRGVRSDDFSVEKWVFIGCKQTNLCIIMLPSLLRLLFIGFRVEFWSLPGIV